MEQHDNADEWDRYLLTLPNNGLARLDTGDQLARTPQGKAVDRLKFWATKIQDGGELTLRIPDFDSVVLHYRDGTGDAEELALADGKYRSIWNRDKVSRALNLAGIEVLGGREVAEWVVDGWIDILCRKLARPAPKLPMRDIRAMMSLPRLAWTDTFGAVQNSCAHLGIDFIKSTGVFWGQCMDRMFSMLADGPDAPKYALTIDYDSVFDTADIVRLWQVMETNPQIDALFPLQIGRDRDRCLLTMKDADGKRITKIRSTDLHTDAIPCETGHFGLTLIRTAALRKLARPMFLGQPASDGSWNDGRVDDDIFFWKRMEEAGATVAVCPRVRIGHLQNIVTWAGEDLGVIHQYLSKYHDDGRPKECLTY
jgi:hypothetical protein